MYRETGFGVRGWARLIDSDVVDLVISIIIINLTCYSTGPGALPNKGTMVKQRPSCCLTRL